LIRRKTKASHQESQHPPVNQRRRAERSGRVAEALVIIWLLVRFHRILAWRWKCHAGEIDLVARRGRTICFFEVKYRRRHDVAAAPSPRQQQRIIRAAEDFANRRRISRNLEWRFDLVQVGWPSPAFPWILRHLPHAWDASPGRNTLRRP